jgi:hypothetical protein
MPPGHDDGVRHGYRASGSDPATTTEVVETGRRSHGVAAKSGFPSLMRTDLVIVGIVGSFALLLGLMGFFILDWSPVLSGLLIAVAVLADGYFLYGCVQLAKERQAKENL